MIATVCLALTMGLQGSGAQFSNPELNFTFTHPKEWRVSTTKKAVSTVVMPLPDSRDKASIEIFAVSYRLAAETWLEMQTSVAKNMGHEVIRQWTEDLLGVPLLLTRTQVANADGEQTALQGLLYSATTRKFLFRLTAPTASFAQAEAEWRKVWPTMRTVDGTLPKSEDPNRVVEEVEPAQQPVFRPTPVVVLSKAGAVAKPELAPVAIECATAGRALQLRVPEGWSGAKREDGAIELSHPALSSPLEVRVFSTLDSDLPRRALFLASNRSLGAYEAVALREEPAARLNKAGATVMHVWRVGRSTAGEVRSLDAVGQSGDFYWIFSRSWQGAFDPASRDLLFALMQAMSVEQVP